MSQLSAPNLNIQAFSFQGHYLFAISILSLLSSHFSHLFLLMKLNLPREGQIQSFFAAHAMCWLYLLLSLPNSFLCFYPLSSTQSSLPCPALHSPVIVFSSSSSPSSHLYSCYPIVPSLSPPHFYSFPSSLYISLSSTKRDNFHSTVDSLILLPVLPLKFVKQIYLPNE